MQGNTIKEIVAAQRSQIRCLNNLSVATWHALPWTVDKEYSTVKQQAKKREIQNISCTFFKISKVTKPPLDYSLVKH